jgi:hypothetical protein
MPHGDLGDNATLSLRPVGQLTGRFWVRSYQRGYRWGTDEVGKLLDDIAESLRDREELGKVTNYCLQPIVVRALEDGRYELIDGQQRLTTLYLVFRCIQELCLPKAVPPFSLDYETRPRSAEYLATLAAVSKDDNIDFAHMYGAYQYIRNWFGGQPEQQSYIGIFNRHLCKFVHVIWFEAPASIESTTLFSRLNVGRIPLTNAELIKAKFLARQKVIAGRPVEVGTDAWRRRQLEIAGQWDSIERVLHEPEYWAFLTNLPVDSYPCRIDLVFDLMAGRADVRRGPFDTFEYFQARLDNERVEVVWQSVVSLCSLLREWYEQRDLYHWVGYLVATGKDDVRDARGVLASLVDAAQPLTKTGFRELLQREISDGLNATTDDIREWTYEGDGARISKLLLLFNVESVRRLTTGERYPFAEHKVDRTSSGRGQGKRRWSLEHIHAQNAQDLRRAEQQRTWLQHHRDALGALDNAAQADSLRTSIDKVLGDLDGPAFQEVAHRVLAAFTIQDGTQRLHGVANLALLDGSQNSALNNAAFEVKRRRVINFDRAGAYVPLGTRRVFLKYYTDTESQQLHFWGPQDQEAYFAEIEKVVGPYLKTTEQETP